MSNLGTRTEYHLLLVIKLVDLAKYSLLLNQNNKHVKYVLSFALLFSFPQERNNIPVYFTRVQRLYMVASLCK